MERHYLMCLTSSIPLQNVINIFPFSFSKLTATVHQSLGIVLGFCHYYGNQCRYTGYWLHCLNKWTWFIASKMTAWAISPDDQIWKQTGIGWSVNKALGILFKSKAKKLRRFLEGNGRQKETLQDYITFIEIDRGTVQKKVKGLKD